MGRTERLRTRLRPIILCPGFHAAQITDSFVRSLPPSTYPLIVNAFPANPLAVYDWLVATHRTTQDISPHSPLIAIGFSAGVVGLTGALTLWQQQGGKILRFFAIDGWGVPISGLPVQRLSHDRFTHWSTVPLGIGKINFYADPAVEHLQMWESPEHVYGRQIYGWQTPEQNAIPISAADFLRQQIAQALSIESQ
ncbi:MAG: hypothetical protein HC800_05580 [Phormidesmis sp. RL_2_1]|nr:hypothetical protein [Phormidesmis sp. RL_2_1]